MRVGDRVEVPHLATLRDGRVGGVVEAVRDGSALVNVDRTGGRHWFPQAELVVEPAPDPHVERWFYDTPPLVVVPCGMVKLSVPAPAGELYVGAQHVLARRAADVVARATGGQVVILSAKHGLLDLAAVIEPYDLTVSDPRAVTAEVVSRQLLSRDARRVVALTPRGYSDLLRGSSRIRLDDRLAGTRGLLQQRSVLARIAAGDPFASAHSPHRRSTLS